MASRVELRAATCPPNTPQTAAIEVDLSFDPGTVTEIEIVIPAGHAGVTGLALAQAHGIVIPSSGSTWIVADDEVIRWPVEDFLNNGSWSAFLYNTDGVNQHTWYFRFLITENAGPVAVAPAPLNPDAILAAAPAGGTATLTQAEQNAQAGSE